MVQFGLCMRNMKMFTLSRGLAIIQVFFTIIDEENIFNWSIYQYFYEDKRNARKYAG